MISNSASNWQQNNQSITDTPRRQFTRINMTLSQVLPHFLKSNLVTLREAPKNPNTTVQMLGVLTIMKVQAMIQTTVGL